MSPGSPLMWWMVRRRSGVIGRRQFLRRQMFPSRSRTMRRKGGGIGRRIFLPLASYRCSRRCRAKYRCWRCCCRYFRRDRRRRRLRLRDIGAASRARGQRRVNGVFEASVVNELSQLSQDGGQTVLSPRKTTPTIGTSSLVVNPRNPIFLSARENLAFPFMLAVIRAFPQLTT